MSKRPCPSCASLEREVSVLRADLARIRAEPSALPLSGCGDGACVVATPEGQHTNSRCRCTEWQLRAALEWWRRYAQFLGETIRGMREAGAEGRAVSAVAAEKYARADDGIARDMGAKT